MWDNEDIIDCLDVLGKPQKIDSYFDKKELDHLVELVARNLELDKETSKKLYDNKLWNPCFGLNRFNCFKIVRSMEIEFKIKLNYQDIDLFALESVYSLLSCIVKAKV